MVSWVSQLEQIFSGGTASKTPLLLSTVLPSSYKRTPDEMYSVRSVVISKLCYNVLDVAPSGDVAITMVAAQ